jgi:hypothetical protein
MVGSGMEYVRVLEKRREGLVGGVLVRGSSSGSRAQRQQQQEQEGLRGRFSATGSKGVGFELVLAWMCPVSLATWAAAAAAGGGGGGGVPTESGGGGAAAALRLAEPIVGGIR